jgi:hypothetical protein
METLRAFALAVCLTGFYGCLDASPEAPPGPPAFSVEGGTDAGSVPPITDGAITADVTQPLLVTGLGSGAITRSAHFTLVTKTGQEPGGAGVKRSTSFKMVSGTAPAGALK